MHAVVLWFCIPRIRFIIPFLMIRVQESILGSRDLKLWVLFRDGEFLWSRISGKK